MKHSGSRFVLVRPRPQTTRRSAIDMDPRIALTIARMEDALTDTPSVPKMAAAVDLSLSRFAHLFRDETGVPPARYLHTVRMQRARVLLERTFLSVKEVMARVGF